MNYYGIAHEMEQMGDTHNPYECEECLTLPTDEELGMGDGGWCVTCDAYTPVLYYNDTCKKCHTMFKRMGWSGH